MLFTWRLMARYMEQVTGVVIRKINRNGGSLAINIPKQWIKSQWYKLKKEGEKIILEPI